MFKLLMGDHHVIEFVFACVSPDLNLPSSSGMSMPGGGLFLRHSRAARKTQLRGAASSAVSWRRRSHEVDSRDHDLSDGPASGADN